MTRPQRTRFFLATALTLGLAGAGIAVFAPKATEKTIGQQDDGTILVSSHQRLTPTGTVQTLDGSRPKDVALSPDGKTLAVLAQGRVVLYGADGMLRATVSNINAGPLGIAWAPDSSAIYAAQADGKVARIVADGTGFKKESDLTIDTVGADLPPDVAAGTQGQGRAKGDPQVAGIAVSSDGNTLFVALGIRNQLAVADAKTGKVSRLIPVGIAPYHVALSPDGKTLAVACRGGRTPRKEEQSAPSAGTAVRVDRKTDAALKGGIAFIDTTTYAPTLIEAGRQPGGMVFTPDSKTLYAASTDDDTVLLFDAVGKTLRNAWTVRPAQDPGFGQIPTDVALSSNGQTLYVSCGGANAVTFMETKSGRVTGHLPTGWYPIALAERGGTLFVASSKGMGSRAKRERGDTVAYGVHGTIGMVQTIALTDARRNLAALSKQVAANNRWGMEEKPARSGVQPVPVPERVGEPSVFKHVVYIIKENQTYDGVFGDMSEGNGEPKLCTFPEEVTPNHHALARQFVLLDNTYTSGTNSADGHQWTVSGVGNAYIEQNYAAHSRSYPYDGGDPLAYSPEGFLWTAALAKGKSVRVYGEFVNKPSVKHRTTGKSGSWSELWTDYKAGMKNYEITADTDNAALKPYLHPNYIGFPSIVVDQWRADQFIGDMNRFEAANKMPDLCILLLPNDHTMGTRPTTPTPRACVADNDLALGRIVDRISKSPFWKDTLILVMEDDSQYGVDHVDGHRTVALCISAYTKRGQVIHEQYDHTSFLRTIGLVLGFPAMNRFDRTALPMTACFQPIPDRRPFIALPNRIPLDEMNPPTSALTGEAKRWAIASARLDWSDVDRADSETVSRAIWHSQFPNRPFPLHAYHPVEKEDDDE